MMTHEQSPEKTGRYECQHCGNRERFTGHDDRGYPGKEWEDHDAGCPLDCDDPEPGAYCTCEVTLSQPFTVDADGEIDYDRHEGGASGAEIGSYTRIDCGVCGLNIWTESPAVVDAAADTNI